MKNCLTLLLLTIGISAFAQDNSTLDWMTNLEDAQIVAKKEKKPILVYFTGSDWCAPCKKLKADFFDSEEFKALSDSMVLVYVDYPRRQDIITADQLAYNKDLIARLNPEKSFPTLVMLNYKGKRTDEISGYTSLRDTRYHFEFLERNL